MHKALSRKHEAKRCILAARHPLSEFWQAGCLRSLEPPAMSGSACSQAYECGGARERRLLLTQELQGCADTQGPASRSVIPVRKHAWTLQPPLQVPGAACDGGVQMSSVAPGDHVHKHRNRKQWDRPPPQALRTTIKCTAHF